MLISSKLKLKVKKVNEETREFLAKDGTSKVSRRVVNIALVDDEGDFVKCTSFDPTWPIPKEGDMWSLPPVRRLECFDGMVQNVML